VDTTLVTNSDWGEWSNFYQFSSEQFQSETPRRFVQLELILSTEDPQVAPALNSLSIEFEDALVQRAAGRVLPRHTEVNVDTRFTYSLWPDSDERDTGFNRLRLTLLAGTSAQELTLHIDGADIAPNGVEIIGDSLLVIELPERIRQDSLEIGFTARVTENATLFVAELGDSERPNLWQTVEAAERQANIVFLPGLVDSDELIANLTIAPPSFTPNGDGINDEVTIRFAVLKLTQASPRVDILDLTGNKIAEARAVPGLGLLEYRWDGRDKAGQMVAPGLYLCKIDLGAASGQDKALRSIAVAY
jgi:hypothetical protein